MPNLERHIDGDAGFIGIDTRSNPITLKTGVLQDGRNIRLDLNTIQVRKGFARILDDVQASTIGHVYGTGIYVQPDGTELVVIVVSDGLYVFDILSGELFYNFKVPFPDTFTSIGGSVVRRTINQPVKLIQAVNKMYILRGEATRYIEGDGSVGQRVVSSGTTATVTCVSNHNLSVGDEFVIETQHNLINGPTVANKFVVDTVISNLSFTYKYASTHNGTSGYVIQVAKPVLVFDGINVNVVKQGIIDGSVYGGTSPTACDFPPTSTAIYHKNRIYCKYSKDEIAVSDYLPDTNGDWQFDLTIQALTINQGDEQDIKGFHPWTKDEILVFKTNSIYSAKFADNTSSPDVVLANSYVKSLTFDIGCVSTDSIANVSGSVFFLSQRGIYVLDPQLDTNLLANTAPMSVDIQKYINRINQKYAYNAYGKVYNGRFYLAVPLDNSQVNNAIFIYNLTNKMWESVDTFPSQIIPRGLFVAKYDEVNTTSRLFTWTDNKGIYLFEEADNDEYGALISGLKLDFYLPNVFTEDRYEYDVIDGYALTRRYIYNTLHQKRFASAGVDIDFNEVGVVKTSVITYNTDTQLLLDVSTASLREDKTRKFPIRKVATGAELEFISLQGNPVIKSYAIEATLAGRDLRNKD